MAYFFRLPRGLGSTTHIKTRRFGHWPPHFDKRAQTTRHGASGQTHPQGGFQIAIPRRQDRSANRDSCLRKSFRLHAKIGTRGAIPGRPRRSTVVDSRPENRRKCTQNHLRIRKIEAESMVQSMEGPHAAERLLPPRISAAMIDCVTELQSSSTGTTPSTRARPQHAWRARPRCCSSYTSPAQASAAD